MAQQNTISILIQAQDQASSTLGNMVDSFQDGMKKVSLVTGAAGVALTAFSKSSVDYLKDVVTSSKALAQQTGMTVEQSSQLIAAMQRVGLSSDQASTAFKRFSQNIADSRDNASQNAAKVADMTNKISGAQIEIAKYNAEIAKNGDTSGELRNKIEALNIQIQGYKKNISDSANTLDKLGVSTRDASGVNKGFNTILLEVADKFKQLPDGAEKTADALALFGRSGASMIKILDQGSQGIQDLEAQATKLGLTLTAQNIGAINDYIKSQKDLADSTNGIKIQVGTLTAPILTHFNEVLNQTIQKLVGADAPTKNLVADILAFGGPILTATAAIAGFTSNVAGTLPLLEKFGSRLGRKAGAAAAAGELTEAVAGGGGLLAVLAPAGLVIGATALAAAGGYLAFRHFRDGIEGVTKGLEDGTGEGARYKGAVDLMTLAMDRQRDAQDAVVRSANELKAGQDKLKDAHAQVAATLNTLGTPAQDSYYQALANEATQNLTVLGQEGDLAQKRRDLQAATDGLLSLNDLLNRSLAGTAGAVANLGPAATSVVGALQVVQDKISGISVSWNGFNGQVQSQVTQVNGILFGTQSTINQVQSSFGKLQASASGIKISGGGVTIQGGHLAGGTDFATGGVTLVGERGPELVNMPRGSRVTPARETQKILSDAGKTVHIENLNVNNNVDVRSVIRQIGFKLATA